MITQQGFTDVSLQAAAFLGPGSVPIEKYEKEIFDIVRRDGSVAYKRFKKVRAVGDPHRYYDQTAIATASFGDTTNLSPSSTGPTRTARSVALKALIAQSNVNLYNKLTTQQQGQFEYVLAQDIEDVNSAIIQLSNSAVWTGNDTSLTAPTTLQYMGLLSQLTQTSTIAPGTSIIDGIKAEVAQMMSNNVTFLVRPTAIYVNPVLGDYIDREAKAAHITMNEVEVVAGVSTTSFSTQAGRLPIIPDVFLPATTDSSFGFTPPPAGYKNYFAVIVMEPFIEMPYMCGDFNTELPLMFELGLTGNLNGQFVSVKFDAIFAKGAAYAHAIVVVQRP